MKVLPPWNRMSSYPPPFTEATDIGADFARVPGVTRTRLAFASSVPKRPDLIGRCVIPKSVVVPGHRGGGQDLPAPADFHDGAQPRRRFRLGLPPFPVADVDVVADHRPPKSAALVPAGPSREQADVVASRRDRIGVSRDRLKQCGCDGQG